MRSRIVLFAVVVLAGSSVHAAGNSDKSMVIEKPVVADTPETFAQQAACLGIFTSFGVRANLAVITSSMATPAWGTKSQVVLV